VVDVGAQVAKALGDAQCRAVLTVLREWEGPVPERLLVEEVAALTGGGRAREVTSRERRSARLALYHRTLPRLESLGLVVCRHSRETVELADESTLGALGLDPVDLGAHPGPTWDAVATVLERPRRLAILSDLADGEARTLPELAESVAARELDGCAGECRPDEVERVRLMLYHVDLPELADAGLVEEGWTRGTIAADRDRLSRILDVGQLARLVRPETTP